MFLGVIGRPRPEHNFDGKIHLESISKKCKVTQQKANQSWSNDALVNSEMKEGSWNALYLEGMTWGELKKYIEDTFDLTNSLVIVLRFHTNKGVCNKEIQNQ